MASVKNLASGTLVSGINTTDTALTVNVGNGTSAQLLGVWPSVPFYITVAPSSPSSGVTNSLDSEIMLVTAISAGTNVLNMTVTRAQRDTTAKAFNADDIVTNAVYAEDAVFAAPNGTLESPSPWIETGDIKNGAVTPSKIENANAYNKLVAIGGTEIASNSDLNTIPFCGVGIYLCPTTATVGTLTNCPTEAAFAMRVSQISTTVRNPATDTWVYMVREITDIYGKVWRQRCYVGGTAGTVTYYAWYQVLTEQDGPFVKVQSVVLDGLTTTLAAQVKSLMSAGKDYGRFMCTYDGGSANISDKPTGNTNASFVCEAYCLRRYTASDYRYRVICWVKELDAVFISECTDGTSALIWKQMQSARILYNNSNGTSGDVALADNASNYDYLEVYGVEDGGRKIFTKVLAPASGSKFILYGLFSGNDNTRLYYRGATWEIANPDTTIAATTEKGTFQMSAGGVTVSSSVNVKIRRVVGIKGGA